MIRGELATVPQANTPSLPSPLAIVSAARVRRQMGRSGSATTHIASRAITEGVRGNLMFADVALAATTAISVVQFQKLVRQMHDSHGQVATYAARSAREIAELGRAHAEIVAISQVIHLQSVELRRLLLSAEERRKADGFTGSAARNLSVKSSIRALKSFALIPRLQTARTV